MVETPVVIIIINYYYKRERGKANVSQNEWTTNSIEQTLDTNRQLFYLCLPVEKRTNLVPSRYLFVALTTIHRKLDHQILALVWGTSVLVYSLLLYSINLNYNYVFFEFCSCNAISKLILFWTNNIDIRHLHSDTPTLTQHAFLSWFCAKLSENAIFSDPPWKLNKN